MSYDATALTFCVLRGGDEAWSCCIACGLCVAGSLGIQDRVKLCVKNDGPTHALLFATSIRVLTMPDDLVLHDIPLIHIH